MTTSRSLLGSLTFLALIGLAASECPNACSGHGDCGAFDMCTCWRNWQAADCSERVCPFGMAHVDTPKGDLNHDGSLSTSTVISNHYVYKYGTQEKFPAMQDSAATTLTNSAHFYMECSNKGICDREAGLCKCFEGYEGSACQRASCPNSCSGHGTCESIRELSAKDHSNVYELWDRDVTMGCKCDAGYYGADCSSRYCKYGTDPLYYDDELTYRVNEWNVQFITASTADGTFEIEFFDVFGENFVTQPIKYDHVAKANNCANIRNALEALPNTVVPASSVLCVRDSNTETYRLAFRENPGAAKPINILNLSVPGVTATKVYPGSQSSEFKDFFYSRCEGLQVTLSDAATVANHIGAQSEVKSSAAATLSIADIKKLKKCLGDSNGVVSDNVDVENWDRGVDTDGATNFDLGAYPHAVKLVPSSASSTETEGGLYYLLYFGDANKFYVSSPRGSVLTAAAAYTSATTFHVYTTDATAQIVFDENVLNSDQFFSAYSANVDTKVTARTTLGSSVIYTTVDTSCENNADLANSAKTPTGRHVVRSCLQKGDKIFFVDLENTVQASYTSHIYEVKKVYVTSATATTTATEDRFRIELDKPAAFTTGASFASIYKFHTAGNQDGNVATFYEYNAECSNRGNCDTEYGTCRCFKGYTGDACHVQSSFAF